MDHQDYFIIGDEQPDTPNQINNRQRTRTIPYDPELHFPVIHGSAFRGDEMAPPPHPNDTRHPNDIPPHDGVVNPYPVPVIGPHPSHIQVAKPYLWEQQIQILLSRL